MIIFLYGPDSYRSRKKLNQIVNRYKNLHKQWLNLRYFEGDNLSFEKFKTEFQTNSIFKEKKLFVLRDVFSNSSFKEGFLIQGKDFLKSDLILIYEEGDIKDNDPLLKFLRINSKFQQFELLKGKPLKNWTREEFQNHQAQIEPEALETFIEFVGNDSWRIANEVEKLVGFKGSPNTSRLSKIKITLEDIKLLVKPNIETDIFSTIDAIASRDKKRALYLIHQHLAAGDSPTYLLSMINFQFRNLLIMKEFMVRHSSPYAFSKVVHLHPYVIKKSCSQARKFTLEELKKIYRKIFQVDLDIKTGNVTPEAGLDFLITGALQFYN